MSHCVRIAPLVMLALFALKARWLFGLVTGSAPRAAVATTTTSAAASAPGLAASGVAEVVSQFFVWFFVIIVLSLLGGLVSMLVGEIKLRREVRGDAAWRRAERARLRADSPWYR